MKHSIFLLMALCIGGEVVGTAAAVVTSKKCQTWVSESEAYFKAHIPRKHHSKATLDKWAAWRKQHPKWKPKTRKEQLASYEWACGIVTEAPPAGMFTGYYSDGINVHPVDTIPVEPTLFLESPSEQQDDYLSPKVSTIPTTPTQLDGSATSGGYPIWYFPVGGGSPSGSIPTLPVVPVTPVPEPSGILLVLTGVGAILVRKYGN